MRKRAYIRIVDDAQVARIDSIAAELRVRGLDVTNIAHVAGQITGTADEADLPGIQSQAASFGARFITEDEDTEHRLPHPDSDLQ